MLNLSETRDNVYSRFISRMCYRARHLQMQHQLWQMKETEGSDKSLRKLERINCLIGLLPCVDL